MEKHDKTRDNVIPMRKKQKKPVTRQMIGFLIVAILLLILLLGFVFTQCKIDTILITGNETYTQDEIEAAVRSSIPDNTVIAVMVAFFSKNDYLPFVEKSRMTLLGKNIIKVEVQEKLRAGVLKQMSEYFYFDKDGIIREESPNRLKNVPLVSGLKMNDCVLNEQLNPKEEDVFSIILKITQLIIKYELPIQEIQFNTLADIRLTTSNLTIKLGAGNELDAKLCELSPILKELTGRKGVVNMESYSETNKMISFQDTAKKTKSTKSTKSTKKKK